MKLINNLYFYPEQGMLDCNTYVITGNPGVIIDPGNPSYLAAKVDGFKQDGVDVKSISIIANTHLHIDHCSANTAFKQLSGASIAMHPVQKENYQLVVVDGARLFGMEPGGFTEDYCLEKDRFRAGELELEFFPAPGHSPDSVCFYLRQEKVLFCGDVLFDHNTGRVDLPGGNGAELQKSIEMLSKLEIEYLLPGHMSIVKGAEQIVGNFDFVRDNIFPWL